VTLTRRAVQELLAAHGLRPSRSLGQHFVADPNTVRRIARLAELGPSEPVIEIGAGLGSLTVALAETGATVVAVEADRHLLPILRAQVEPLGVRVVEGDALTVDFAELLAPPEAGSTPWTLVANLPYNVAVPIVMRVLDEVAVVRRLLVMVQREVGERMAAAPGAAAYGAVSVRVAYHARARLVGRVPATVFVPRPRVESVLVRMDRRSVPAVDPAVVSPERLFAVVRAGFAQRRKMLRRSLAGVVGPECFEAARIEPTARAEELSVEQWGRLAACSS
jgi:16S rRNA (adenine1518-N6/adenine1519-N6)-dimethyltransferase